MLHQRAASSWVCCNGLHQVIHPGADGQHQSIQAWGLWDPGGGWGGWGGVHAQEAEAGRGQVVVVGGQLQQG